MNLEVQVDLGSAVDPVVHQGVVAVVGLGLVPVLEDLLPVGVHIQASLGVTMMVILEEGNHLAVDRAVALVVVVGLVLDPVVLVERRGNLEGSHLDLVVVEEALEVLVYRCWCSFTPPFKNYKTWFCVACVSELPQRGHLSVGQYPVCVSLLIKCVDLLNKAT